VFCTYFAHYVFQTIQIIGCLAEKNGRNTDHEHFAGHNAKQTEKAPFYRFGSGFGFFATVTGVFGHGAMLEGFFATGNARGFIATVQKVFSRERLSAGFFQ